MINELVIHLGDTKTGSTSIQKALVAKAYDIPGKTLLYPTMNNHVGLAKTLTLQRRFEEREKRFTRVYKAVKASDADFGIVSAEHFQFVDPRVLNEAIESYWPDLRDRIRLVAYVRPHGSKILSTFAERVKLGSDIETLEDFIDMASKKRLFDYAERFAAWREVFGARFTLRPFIRDRLYKRDAVQDFFRYVVGNEGFEITEEIAANSSLTISQLALLREMHRYLAERTQNEEGLPQYREARGSVGRVMAEYMRDNALGQDGEKVRIPASRVDFIKERYAADAEALDTAFFDGFPMSDELEKIGKSTTEAAQSLEASDYFSPDVLNCIGIFSNVLADLTAQSPGQIKTAITRSRAGTDADA